MIVLIIVLIIVLMIVMCWCVDDCVDVLMRWCVDDLRVDNLKIELSWVELWIELELSWRIERN